MYFKIFFCFILYVHCFLPNAFIYEALKNASE